MISQKTSSTLKITIGTILVTFGTLLLIAFSSGYNFDFIRGEVFSTGLVLLGSNPSGSSIKINSKDLKQKTPYRLENFKTGNITVELNRPEYKPWKSNYTVLPGQVTFADYALLIPEKIEQSNNFTNIKFDSLITSEDKNKVFGFSNKDSSIYALDDSNSPKRIIELPPNSAIQLPNSLTENIISRDGSALITRANYADGSSVKFWVNTNSGQLINIESLLLQKPNDINISLKNSKELFNLVDGKIIKLNVDNQQKLDLPVGLVASYQLDKDHIYTLENLIAPEQGQSLVRYDYSGNNRIVLAKLPLAASPRAMEITEYSNQKLITIRSITEGTMYVYRQADGKNLTSLLGSGITISRFSPDGKLLSYIQNNKLRTIDLQTGDRFSVDSEGTNSISWITNHQLIIAKADGLYIVDFNGYNFIKLPPNTQNAAQYSYTIQQDKKAIYYSLDGNLSYFTLQPKGLINFN